MTNLKYYINLTRINKPIGIGLLFLPCLFGIALSVKESVEANWSLVTVLFLVGAIIMRSAGCVINDILDRNLDKKIARTKMRPIAAGKIAVSQALILLVLLLLLALIILFQFNQTTIFLGFAVFLLVLLYPLTKRFIDYPQLFLGITFNFGILMAGTAINNKITLPIFLLYLSAILWTIIYDTIYAYQDLEDDIKIGIKSTAVRFGKNPKNILYLLLISQISLLGLVGIVANLKAAYYFWIILAFCLLLCQIKSCDFTNGSDCLKKFKSNLWVGFIIAGGIILG